MTHDDGGLERLAEHLRAKSARCENATVLRRLFASHDEEDGLRRSVDAVDKLCRTSEKYDPISARRGERSARSEQEDARTAGDRQELRARRGRGLDYLRSGPEHSLAGCKACVAPCERCERS